MPMTPENIKALFDKYAGGNKTMTKEEFLQMVSTEFPDAGITTMEEVEVFMAQCDDNSDGTLTFKEVKNLLTPLCLVFK